jgi:hypothetical protein
MTGVEVAEGLNDIFYAFPIYVFLTQQIFSGELIAFESDRYRGNEK